MPTSALPRNTDHDDAAAAASSSSSSSSSSTAVHASVCAAVRPEVMHAGDGGGVAYFQASPYFPLPAFSHISVSARNF